MLEDELRFLRVGGWDNLLLQLVENVRKLNEGFLHVTMEAKAFQGESINHSAQSQGDLYK